MQCNEIYYKQQKEKINDNSAPDNFLITMAIFK